MAVITVVVVLAGGLVSQVVLSNISRVRIGAIEAELDARVAVIDKTHEYGTQIQVLTGKVATNAARGELQTQAIIRLSQRVTETEAEAAIAKVLCTRNLKSNLE